MKIVVSVILKIALCSLPVFASAETGRDTVTTTVELEKNKFRRIRHEVAFGPLGGAGLSFLRGHNNTDGTKPLPGLTGGVAFEAGIKDDNVSIYSECTYFEPGYRYKGRVLSTVDKTVLLRFPVLLKYKFNPKEGGASITIGPYWDRVLHSVAKYSFGDNSTKEIIKPLKPTVNMGVSAGAGWSYPTERGVLNVDFRGYYYVGNNHQRFNNTGQSVYSFALSVAYLFRFP